MDLEEIGCGLDLSYLRYGTVASSCEHGNEFSSSLGVKWPGS